MRYQIRAELPDGKGCVDFDVTGPVQTEDSALDKVRSKAEIELRGRYNFLRAPKFEWVGFVVFVKHGVSEEFQNKMNRLVRA